MGSGISTLQAGVVMVWSRERVAIVSRASEVGSWQQWRVVRCAEQQASKGRAPSCLPMLQSERASGAVRQGGIQRACKVLRGLGCWLLAFHTGEENTGHRSDTRRANGAAADRAGRGKARRSSETRSAVAAPVVDYLRETRHQHSTTTIVIMPPPMHTHALHVPDRRHSQAHRLASPADSTKCSPGVRALARRPLVQTLPTTRAGSVPLRPIAMTMARWSEVTDHGARRRAICSASDRKRPCSRYSTPRDALVTVQYSSCHFHQTPGLQWVRGGGRGWLVHPQGCLVPTPGAI